MIPTLDGFGVGQLVLQLAVDDPICLVLVVAAVVLQNLCVFLAGRENLDSDT
jgi:hypothetical protein